MHRTFDSNGTISSATKGIAPIPYSATLSLSIDLDPGLPTGSLKVAVATEQEGKNIRSFLQQQDFLYSGSGLVSVITTPFLCS